MRVLMTSSGLVMVVVTRPAIMEDVKWVTVPSALYRQGGHRLCHTWQAAYSGGAATPRLK
jgi:hypothetical protein